MQQILFVLSFTVLLSTHCTRHSTTTTSNTSTNMTTQSNQEAIIVNKNNKYGVQKGNEIIVPIQYDAVILSTNKLYYWVVLGSEYGLFSINGTEIYSCIFTEYEDFETNRSAIVLYEERYYLLHPITGLMIEESAARYKEELLDLDKDMRK